VALRESGERAAAELYEARLARRILRGGAGAAEAARSQGVLTSEARDCVADAWETHRHLRELSWD
jgi:hypothetical protein